MKLSIGRRQEKGFPLRVLFFPRRSLSFSRSIRWFQITWQAHSRRRKEETAKQVLPFPLFNSFFVFFFFTAESSALLLLFLRVWLLLHQRERVQKLCADSSVAERASSHGG